MRKSKEGLVLLVLGVLALGLLLYAGSGGFGNPRGGSDEGVQRGPAPGEGR